jgi:hypothetical protein
MRLVRSLAHLGAPGVLVVKLFRVFGVFRGCFFRLCRGFGFVDLLNPRFYRGLFSFGPPTL